MGFDEFYFWRAKTKRITGGIKAHVKKFGTQWWTVRWLEAIEKFGPEKRVARGRSYARKGQIMDMHFEAGKITATVQGSREDPYKVAIFLVTISDSQQPDFIRDFRSQPIFAATLLTGELHPNTEHLFFKYGVPLFPTKEEGSRSICSCPDDKNPCKHIAAVYYMISVELERDPFLLLKLRGISRDHLLPSQAILFTSVRSEPLPSDPLLFWRAPRLPEVPLPDLKSSTSAKPAVLQRLGPFPQWRGEQNFLEILERLYRRAAERLKQE